MINPLLVYSNHGFGSFSSYPVISKYIKNSSTLSTLREEPKTFSQRALNWMLRNFSTSQWYKLTSLDLEIQLVRKICHERPQLVHFLWAERDLGYFNVLNQFIDLPICATFHCCPEDLPTILTFPKRLKGLSAIIIMSETQRVFFESSGVDPHKIHCIHHGIDTDFFAPSYDSKTPDRFTVLSVGSYKRNFPLLRKVAVKLQRYPEISFKVVSGKSFYPYFADLDNVEFVSGLSDSGLLNTYQQASCLLLAVENATANNALLEGLACGLPIISEDIGGIPEYVDTTCAMLSEADNSDLLVESILTLFENSSKQRKMAEAARAKALDFSWEKVALRTQELYKSLQ